MGTIILLQKPTMSFDSAVLEPTVTATWVTFVKEGETRVKHNLGEELESFLVFTLMRLVRRTDIFTPALGLEYYKASTEYVGRKKEEALGEIGDTSLILAGLFPERHRRLNVSSSYFSEIGRLAFRELADSLSERNRVSLAKLYHNVNNGFISMTDVLLAARENKFSEASPIIKKPGFLSLQ
ncbi:MAG: hypothetical protein M0P64_01655 [Candidatus Pacebacteria bacterium]|jgi:hypothetical protein|nr:hypothetical protein [Candidatus Paceibacterota bacterium]